MMFGTDIISTYKRIFKENINNSIIALTTAASILDLTNNEGYPIRLYTTDDIINSSLIKSEKCNKIDTFDTEVIDGVTVTNIERTVCELLKVAESVDEFTLLECIHMANCKIGRERLVEASEKYNVRDILESKWADAMEIYDE